MSFAKVTIAGNLGKDPELRYTPAGKPVTNFSVATSDKRKDKQGEYQEITTWWKVTVWGNQAENAAKYLAKGSLVSVIGTPHVEEWTDRDNVGRWSLEINADTVHFLGAKPEGAGQSAPASTGAGAPPPATTPVLKKKAPGAHPDGSWVSDDGVFDWAADRKSYINQTNGQMYDPQGNLML